MGEGRFENRVGIITGAASGIGAATALRLAGEGALLVLADLDEDRGQQLAAELGENVAIFARCEVADHENVERLVAAAMKRFARIDMLFNNAGIGCLAKTPEMSIELWHRVVAVDLHAIFYACRAAIPEMRKSGGGVIVNTASISGMAADYGFTAYNAAKAAAINYTRALAIDHAAEGIRVNAICPGLIDTPMTAGVHDVEGLFERWASGVPMRRAGTPKEMAAVVAFLMSDDASYVTGAILPADGGVSAWTGQPDVTAIIPPG